MARHTLAALFLLASAPLLADDLADALAQAQADLDQLRTMRANVFNEYSKASHMASDAVTQLNDLKTQITNADAAATGYLAVQALVAPTNALNQQVQALQNALQATATAGQGLQPTADQLNQWAAAAPSASDEQLDQWITQGGEMVDAATHQMAQTQATDLLAAKGTLDDSALKTSLAAVLQLQSQGLAPNGPPSLPDPAGFAQAGRAIGDPVATAWDVAGGDAGALQRFADQIHDLLRPFLSDLKAKDLDAQAGQLAQGLAPSIDDYKLALSAVEGACTQYGNDRGKLPAGLNPGAILSAARDTLSLAQQARAGSDDQFARAMKPLRDAKVALARLRAIRAGRHGGHGQPVPDVVGMKSSEARDTLVAAGLAATFAPADKPTPSADKVNTVESQSPAAGSSASSGSPVTLLIYPKQGSDTADMTEVPGVVSLKTSDARYLIEQAGLLATYESNNDDPPSPDLAFTVRSQYPPQGTQVRKGSMVILRLYGAKVPRPADTTAVPNVVGSADGPAMRTLQGKGFQGQESADRPAPSEDKEGVVYAQDPQGGTQVPAGTTVVIYVYAAMNPLAANMGQGGARPPHPPAGPQDPPPPAVQPPPPPNDPQAPPPAVAQQRAGVVPNIVGMKKAVALQALGVAGVKLYSEQQSKAAPSADQVGAVFAQQPKGGQPIPPNGTVLIWVYGPVAQAQQPFKPPVQNAKGQVFVYAVNTSGWSLYIGFPAEVEGTLASSWTDGGNSPTAKVEWNKLSQGFDSGAEAWKWLKPQLTDDYDSNWTGHHVKFGGTSYRVVHLLAYGGGR